MVDWRRSATSLLKVRARLSVGFDCLQAPTYRRPILVYRYRNIPWDPTILEAMCPSLSPGGVPHELIAEDAYHLRPCNQASILRWWLNRHCHNDLNLVGQGSRRKRWKERMWKAMEDVRTSLPFSLKKIAQNPSGLHSAGKSLISIQ